MSRYLDELRRSRARGMLIIGGMGLAGCLVLAGLFLLQGSVRRPTPLVHSAYVWQRTWRPEVGEAIRQAAPYMSDFLVLVSEVSWEEKESDPRIVRIKPDYAAAHYHLGNALKAKGLHDEAIESYENFIRCAPPSYAERVVQVKQVIRELKGSW